MINYIKSIFIGNSLFEVYWENINDVRFVFDILKYYRILFCINLDIIFINII